MVTARDINSSQERWSSGVQNGRQNYQEGVENPLEDWKEETQAAEGRWEQGVRNAADEGRFGTGISPVETADWQQFATELGPSRYGQAADAYDGKYAEKFAPFLETIQQTSLPSRGPAGDPANIDRVQAIAEALHNRKTQG